MACSILRSRTLAAVGQCGCVSIPSGCQWTEAEQSPTLSPSTLVADVVTNPKVTPWLAAALQKGCEVQYGAEMAYGQFGLMGRHMGLEIPDPEDLSMVI